MDDATIARPRSRQEYLAHCKARNNEFLNGLRSQRRWCKIEYVYVTKALLPGFGWVDLKDIRKQKAKPEAVFIAWEQPDGTLAFGWSQRNKAMRGDGVTPVEPLPFLKSDGLRRAIERSNSQDDLLPRRRVGNQYQNFRERAQTQYDERKARTNP